MSATPTQPGPIYNPAGVIRELNARIEALQIETNNLILGVAGVHPACTARLDALAREHEQACASQMDELRHRCEEHLGEGQARHEANLAALAQRDHDVRRSLAALMHIMARDSAAREPLEEMAWLVLGQSLAEVAGSLPQNGLPDQSWAAVMEGRFAEAARNGA
jgi:hypothetical protein